MNLHPHPIIGYYLIGGSGGGPADRGVSPGWYLRERGWTAVAEKALADYERTGVRRYWLHNPGGILKTDEPQTITLGGGWDMSFRQWAIAQKTCPWLYKGFAAAWAPVLRQIPDSELTVYLGCPRSSWVTLARGANFATLLRRVADCMQPMAELAQACPGKVRWFCDAVNDPNNKDEAYFALMEMGRAMGLRTGMEGPPHPLAPHHWKYDGAITQQSYSFKQDSWLDESKLEGELVRICDAFAIPEPDRQLPHPQNWKNVQTWLPAWIDGVVKLGHTAAINPDALVVRAERWDR